MLPRIAILFLLFSTPCRATDYSACLSKQATSPAELVQVVETGTRMSNPKFTRDHWVKAFSSVGLKMTTDSMLDFVKSMEAREISTMTTALFVMFAKRSGGTLEPTTTTNCGMPHVRRFQEKEWVLYSRRNFVGVSSLRGLVFRWSPPTRTAAPVVLASVKKITSRRNRSERIARYNSTSCTDGYYAMPLREFRKTQGIHGANAVDLAAPIGTPVIAAAGGVVIESDTGDRWNHGHGNCVVIRHENKTETLYCHLSENLVGVGDKVEQGEEIGLVGVTGHTTGPHLHFEVHGARNPA